MKNFTASAGQNPVAQPETETSHANREVSMPTEGTMNAVIESVAKPLSKLSEFEFYAWLIAFAPVFATLYESLGFAKAVSISVNNDAAWANYVVTRESFLEKTLKLVRLFRYSMYNGDKKGQSTPSNPENVVEPVPPVTEMVPGMYLRLLNLVAQIRKSPNFNESIASQLGIDWKPGGGSKPSDLGIQVFQTAKGPELRWTKNGVKSGTAYFEADKTGEGLEQNFAFFKSANTSPLVLSNPDLPEGQTAAVWAVRYCMIVDNEPTKVWSNIAKVTVSSVNNKPKAAKRKVAEA